MGLISTAMWFAARPPFWGHAAELARRKFRTNHDSKAQRREAAQWAEDRTAPLAMALKTQGITSPENLPEMPGALIDEARERVKGAVAEMGGAGDLNLIHAVAKLTGAQRVLETGVAYGWSSLAVLAALQGREGARLVSVDMPYPGRGNEPSVGIAVPEALHGNWTLLRIPDRPGIPRAIDALGGTLDLAHYDSDKSWYGRRYALEHIWPALRPGGVLLMDDIQDNLAFADFVGRHGLTASVTEAGGKYVGITRKPMAAPG